MKKLFVMSGGKYGFAYDFYNHVLRELGFDLYQLDFNTKLARTRYLLRLLLKKYGVIWCCGDGRGFLTVLARITPLLSKRLENTKIIVRFHREVSMRFEESGWKAYATIMGCDKVVWMYNCYDWLKHFLPALPRSKFFVVHNGIDLDVYKSNPKKRGENTIFTLSNWYRPKKRLETLISTMELLPDWYLTIGGNFLQKDYEAYCRRLARNYGDRVKFLGFVDNKAGWMQNSEFFVMPSMYESWSTQLMEAMACGCKVLRVEGGGAHEFLPKEELLPKDFTAELLAERILELSDNDKLVGINLNQVKNFTWSKVREETERVLEG